jgi:ABC-type Fe3+/spermidine/putrescine transport system ATPase subunit
MTVTQEHILEVGNLSKSFAGGRLIEDVSFNLKKGEILCLLGPSGAGKTTLLRLIAGLETADSGSLFFQSMNINEVAPHKRNFGMMFQEYALFPHKNVWQNVAFGLEMKKCRIQEQFDIIGNILNVVGLAGFGERRIDELSGGERQRVALARSLAPEPELLLLDEPFGSLDRGLRDRLTEEIREILTSLKVTAIFVTHDQAEAFSVADKIAILHEGRLEQFGPPETLYRHPVNRTVAHFLGFKNIFEGELREDGLFTSPLGSLQLGKPGGNTGKHELLIRPDAARFEADSVPSPDWIRLSCRVLARQFTGSRFKVSVEVGGQHLVFELPIDPPPPLVGEKAEICLNPAAIGLLGNVPVLPNWR